MTVNLAIVDSLIKQRIESAARGAADYLREALSQEGSGIQHPGLPNRSSTIDEYAAAQSARLAASITAQPSPGLTAQVGALDNPPPEALKLIITPPSQGGRDWLTKAFHDPLLHQAALDNVGKS